MKTASAPGKVILFGEHSVIYPRHNSLAFAISKRAYAEVSANKSDETTINSSMFGTRTNTNYSLCNLWEQFKKSNNPRSFNEGWYSSIELVLGNIISYYKCKSGFDINIRSDLGRHLGSSSAVSEAVAAAVLAEVKNIKKVNGRFLKEILNIGLQADKLVAGSVSGTDNYIITYGNLVKFHKNDQTNPAMPIEQHIPYDIDLVIADSNVESRTGDMVEMFKASLEKDPSKAKYLDTIDEIVERGISCLKDYDINMFGKCMNENHDILRELGVSHPKLEEIIDIYKQYGYGGKLTGSGGGGCVIGITNDPQTLIKKLNEAGFNKTFITNLNNPGLKLEVQ